MAQTRRKKAKSAALKQHQSAKSSAVKVAEFKVDQNSAFEAETDGKLSPAEAEAIMSSDLPSGDPELSAPAELGDQSPDFSRDSRGKPKKAA